MEKKIASEKKKTEKKEKNTKKCNSNKEMQLREREAQIQLDTEVLHQNEELERRTLGKALLADVAENRPSLNQSSANLLVNYQG